MWGCCCHTADQPEHVGLQHLEQICQGEGFGKIWKVGKTLQCCKQTLTGYFGDVGKLEC